MKWTLENRSTSKPKKNSYAGRGKHKLRLWLGKEADGSVHTTTPGKVPKEERGELERLEKFVNKYERRQIQLVNCFEHRVVLQVEAPKKKVKKSNIPVLEMVYGAMLPADVQQAVEKECASLTLMNVIGVKFGVYCLWKEFEDQQEEDRHERQEKLKEFKDFKLGRSTHPFPPN
ncbi:phosphatidylinositol 3-kinase, root isoform [Tanacetum coccineum]